MAASSSLISCNFTNNNNNNTCLFIQPHHPHVTLLVPNRISFSTPNGIRKSFRSSRFKRDLSVYATPEEAASSFLSFLPADTPWFAWVGCLFVALPLAVQRLINLSNQVEAVAETVESIADTVGKVADEIDKAADEMVEKLPDGTLKNIVNKVDDIAEATSKEAQKVEDLMDKVEEVSNKVEDFLVEKSSKKPGSIND